MPPREARLARCNKELPRLADNPQQHRRHASNFPTPKVDRKKKVYIQP